MYSFESNQVIVRGCDPGEDLPGLSPDHDGPDVLIGIKPHQLDTPPKLSLETKDSVELETAVFRGRLASSK